MYSTKNWFLQLETIFLVGEATSPDIKNGKMTDSSILSTLNLINRW